MALGTLSENANQPRAKGKQHRCPMLSPRQPTCTHQEFVDGTGTLAAFADRPDDERLTAPHIARGEDLGHRGAVVERVGANVAARVELYTGLLDHPGPAGAQKPRRQQDEISLQIEAAARDLGHHKAAVWVLGPFDADAFECGYTASFSDGPFGQHRPVALTALLLRRGGAQ